MSSPVSRFMASQNSTLSLIHIYLDIPLEEAAKGCTKKLAIERLVTCKACHGTGARDGKEAFKTCPCLLYTS